MTGLQISDATILSRAAGVIATEVDGEAILMTIERGQCYGFDPIGTRIWQMIEQPMSFSAICATLLDEYDVDAVACRHDVTLLLAELARERLIVIDNEPRR